MPSCPHAHAHQSSPTNHTTRLVNTSQFDSTAFMCLCLFRFRRRGRRRLSLCLCLRLCLRIFCRCPLFRCSLSLSCSRSTLHSLFNRLRFPLLRLYPLQRSVHFRMQIMRMCRCSRFFTRRSCCCFSARFPTTCYAPSSGFGGFRCGVGDCWRGGGTVGCEYPVVALGDVSWCEMRKGLGRR